VSKELARNDKLEIPKRGVKVLDKTTKVKFSEPRQHGGVPVEPASARAGRCAAFAIGR
jgi:hypothetical protein